MLELFTGDTETLPIELWQEITAAGFTRYSVPGGSTVVAAIVSGSTVVAGPWNVTSFSTLDGVANSVVNVPVAGADTTALLSRSDCELEIKITNGGAATRFRTSNIRIRKSAIA